MNASDEERRRKDGGDRYTGDMPDLSPEARDLAGELLQHAQSIQPDPDFAHSLGERLKKQIPADARPSRQERFWEGLRAGFAFARQAASGAALVTLLVGVIWLAMRVLPNSNPETAALQTTTTSAVTGEESTPTPEALPEIVATEAVGPVAPLHTATPAGPTETPVPTPTQTPVPCNRASFIQDLTIPDGSEFIPGATIYKLWRLQNSGSCPWTSGYRLVFAGGQRMAGEAAPLSREIAPGEVVDVRVRLLAPGEPGEYQSQWMLQSPDGERFGLGMAAEVPFFAEIVVKEASHGAIYDLAANFCAAGWSSASGPLRCPGKEIDSGGYALLNTAPILETGVHEDQPALVTVPQQERDGFIRGVFPAFEVQEGDRFIADIGCLEENPGCQVVFTVGYRILDVDAPIKKLDEWTEVFDGQKTRVDIGLSALAGKQVEFVLTVSADGATTGDQAFWLAPQIYR